MFRCKRMSFWERLNLRLSKKKRLRHEVEQKAIIREMLNNPDVPIEFHNPDGRVEFL